MKQWGTIFHFMSFLPYRQVLGTFVKLWKAVRPSILLSTRDNSVPTERIFIKVDVFSVFQNCLENSSLIQIWQE